MFQVTDDASSLVMEIGILPLAGEFHPFKRMDVLDEVLSKMFRGAYTLAIASGAAPIEVIAAFHMQMRRVMHEMGPMGFEEAGALANDHFNTLYEPQEEVV